MAMYHDPLQFDPREASISTVREAVLSGHFSVRAVTEAFLARIEALNPLVSAIVACHPSALADAGARRLFQSGASSHR